MRLVKQLTVNEKMPHMSKLRALQADITTLAVDAIVNAANEIIVSGDSHLLEYFANRP